MDGIHHFGAHREEMPSGFNIGTGHIGEVVTRRKYRPVGSQNDAAGVAAADAGEHIAQLDHHIERQRVAFLGSIQRDRSDRAFGGDHDMLQIHLLSLSDLVRDRSYDPTSGAVVANLLPLLK